jgi:hypothetical protein
LADNWLILSANISQYQPISANISQLSVNISQYQPIISQYQPLSANISRTLCRTL